MMKKLMVIKKTDVQVCWSCNGNGCKVCQNTGRWNEDTYYHIIEDKNGNKYCFDGDTIK